MSSEDLIREAQDPATTPARLAELAQADRSTWPAIVFNPSAYDGLLQWLGERGDPTVNAALTARSAYAASAQPPAPSAPAPPPPVAASPVAEPVAPSPVAEPVAPSPVAEPVAEAPAPQPPAEEPTAVIPAEPAAQPWSAPEPTAIFSSQPSYPTASAGAATTAMGAVPPGGADQQPDGTGGGSRRPLGLVIGVVVAVIILIGGTAFAATQVFGDDSDDVTASDTRTSDAPTSPESNDAPATPDAPTPDAGSGTSPEFCSTMKDIQDSSMALLDTSSGGTPDLSSIEKMASNMSAAYKSLESSAPAELRADIKVMGSYFDLLDNPTADSGSQLSESLADYSKAAQNLGVYYAKNCL